MQWAKQKQSGFTIVELLIVVVVIAILAAITIVAYNGITTNANNTQTINAVGAHARAINAHAADKGTYPVASYACLGPAGTRCSNTTDLTGVSTCGGYGQASTQTSYLNAVALVASSLPAPSTQTAGCGGKQFAGAWYHSPSGTAAEIVYFLKGDVPCQNIGGVTNGSRTQNESLTICRTSFPSL